MAANGVQGNRLPAFTDETIKQFLDVQKQDLTVRLTELERDKAEIDFNKATAKLSIETEAVDAKHAREIDRKRAIDQKYFVVVLVLLLLLFCGFALWFNKDVLILDILKILCGFAGGYGMSAYQLKKKESQSQDD